MNTLEAIDSVHLFFESAWKSKTLVPIYWDETPKNMIPADDAAEENQQVSPFVVVSTEVLDATQVTLGAAPNRRFRRFGLTTIRIMGPRKQGRLIHDQLVNIVFDSLEGQCTPEGVEFSSPTPLNSFPVGAFLVKQINVEFEYDEIK